MSTGQGHAGLTGNGGTGPCWAHWKRGDWALLGTLGVGTEGVGLGGTGGEGKGKGMIGEMERSGAGQQGSESRCRAGLSRLRCCLARICLRVLINCFLPASTTQEPSRN